MGVLDDAIREHLELKRRHGAAAEELDRQEQEALGPPGGAPPAEEPEPAPVEAIQPEDAPVEEPPAEELAPEHVEAFEPEAPVDPVAPEPELPPEEEQPEAAVPPEQAPLEFAEPEDEPFAAPEPAAEAPAEPGDEDVLEETPEFLQETPEHDRMWFEQKPPRDFDFDES